MSDQNEIEFKAAAVEFKAGDGGSYDGHFSVFGNVDDGNDIAEPGMFAKTLKENGHRVKVFYAHDWMKLIGPPPKVLEEDSVGLHAKGALTVGSFWGREAYELMKDGALTEGSFGYRTVKHDYDEMGIRHLREVKLFEISPVPLGMNPLTQVSLAKGLLSRMTLPVINDHEANAASVDTKWDEAAVRSQIQSPQQMRDLFAWRNVKMDPSSVLGYQLLHHNPNGDVVLDGVKEAASLLAAGAFHDIISVDDLPLVEQHLAGHFHQFGEKAPWEIGPSWDGLLVIEQLLKSVKEGKALVSADPMKLKAFADALEALTEEIHSRQGAVTPVDDNHVALLEVRFRAAKNALDFATQ